MKYDVALMPSQILVVFYSRGGSTETLALAAAVGAVQKRANIRLRRLPDAEAGATPGASSAEAGEDLHRMRKEYVAPKEADILWAHEIISVLPPWLGESSPECAEYFALLRNLGKYSAPVRFTDAAAATEHGRNLATP